MKIKEIQVITLNIEIMKNQANKLIHHKMITMIRMKRKILFPKRKTNNKCNNLINKIILEIIIAVIKIIQMGLHKKP